MANSIEALDKSFNTIFIIISIFNVGIILSNEIIRGETNQAANTQALLVGAVPIMALVLVWWVGEFYDALAFRLVGWLVLFTLVFYAISFISIWAAVDRYLGFSESCLTMGEVIAPMPALVVFVGITRRYCKLLVRPLTRKEKAAVTALAILYLAYWFYAPWEPSKVIDALSACW